MREAFVQISDNRDPRGYPEEEQVAKVLSTRVVPVTRFSLKQMTRRQLPLTRESFVFGSIGATEMAMKILGIPIPKPDYYPECLKPLLRRRVWVSTLGLELSRGHHIFVKPLAQTKKFTGCVLDGSEAWQLEGISRKTPVWCSEVVDFISEWRVYVVSKYNFAVGGLDPHILGTLYPPMCPDEPQPSGLVIDEALDLLQEHGKLLAGLCIDFGVVGSTGETALIEMGDGYSVGNYGLDAEPYTDMVLARWEELLLSQATTELQTSGGKRYKKM